MVVSRFYGHIVPRPTVCNDCSFLWEYGNGAPAKHWRWGRQYFARNKPRLHLEAKQPTCRDVDSLHHKRWSSQIGNCSRHVYEAPCAQEELLMWGDKTYIQESIEWACSDCGEEAPIIEVSTASEIVYITVKSTSGDLVAEYRANEDGTATRIGD